MSARAWARPWAALVLIVVALGSAASALAAVRVHLKDGRAIHAEAALRDGDVWILRLAAGTMRVGARRVERVETIADAEAQRPPRGFNVVGSASSSPGSPDSSRAPRFTDAETRLRSQLVSRPGDASVVIALGRLLIEEGRLGEAVAMLDRVRDHGCCDRSLAERPELVRSRDLALADALSRLDRIDDALAAIEDTPEDEQGSVEALRARLRRDGRLRGERTILQSPNFRLHGPEETPRGGASSLLDHLEQAHAELKRSLRHAPPERIVVILYEGDEFWESTGRGRSIAGLFDGKVRVPAGRIDPPGEQLRRVLRHEVAHAFVHALGRGRVPRTWHEGIAEHFEGADVAASAASLARHLERGDAWPPPIDHAAAHSRYEHFRARCGGDRATVKLIEAFASGVREDEALEGCCNIDGAELDESWRRHLTGERR